MPRGKKLTTYTVSETHAEISACVTRVSHNTINKGNNTTASKNTNVSSTCHHDTPTTNGTVKNKTNQQYTSLATAL